MRSILLGLALAVGVAAWPSPASAVTVDQIISLTRSGVSEAVILSLIERDQTVLTLRSEELVALKRAGVSDTVVMALLRSGREGSDAAKAQVDSNASSISAAFSTAPTVVMVGHGPDRPNSYGAGWPGVNEGYLPSYAPPEAAYSGVVAVPYGYPYGVPAVFPATRAEQQRALRATAGLPPSSFVAVPPGASSRGIFFNGAGPARGTFFRGR
jgi:hypothetical protein